MGDDAAIAGTDPEVMQLTSACFVTIKVDGVQLQQPVEAPPFYIDLPRLRFLAAASRAGVADIDALADEVGRASGVPPGDLVAFSSWLRFANWLLPTDPPAHRSVPDRIPGPGAAALVDLDSPDRLAVRLPLVLRIHDGHFQLIDHGGSLVAALEPIEVEAVAALARPGTARAALEALASSTADAFGEALAPETFARLLGKLDEAGFLTRAAAPGSEPAAPPPIDRDALIAERFAHHAAAQSAEEEEREARTGQHRTKVVPVAFDMGAPAGLGMIVAYCKAFDGGRLEDHFQFRTDWVWSDDLLDELTAEPAIYLFSNYLWSHERCIKVSEAIKERSPDSVTIHGGPDTPKYEADCQGYFANFPHVDVTVRGEGEASTAEALAALASVIGSAGPDLSVLVDVAGISYRRHDPHGGPGTVVRTADRDRIADLAILPSPYLTGLFDVFADIPDLFVTLETNRGCPYGCTFCDWGSATTSRIRQFDLDRVLEEIDWASRTHVSSISIADANFGIFKRDVEIAEHVANVRGSSEFPKAFGVSYAKNTVKHLRQIIEVLSSAGIMTQGVLSLQSMDGDTLKTIHRSNIKTEHYDNLAVEMRQNQLPLIVELMLGLPGQTVESFSEDLQQCIEREVGARVNYTTLLVNSPMNDPDYLAEHKVTTSEPLGPGRNSLVVSTSSFTQQDREVMGQLRLAFLLFENFGVLRLVSRFVRQEVGVREIDFYRTIHDRTAERPSEFPTLYALASLGSSLMGPPYSWSLVMDELRDFVGAEWGVAADSALGAVLSTQRALLPAHGRSFPDLVLLDHDVVGWQRAMVRAKSTGHRDDWTTEAPRLGTFGPSEIVVDDPEHMVDTSIGINRELAVFGINWELDSPLSRARVASTQFIDWASETVLPNGHERRSDVPAGT